ncbi:MAG: glutamate--tRNA ligase, partial [Candidatus Margulisiibacteriota bacterium]
EQVNENISKGLPFAIRFKVANEVVKFRDLVRGEISFDMALNGDLVIMRSDGMPTYNFAVVVDDMEMAITHVIRGEDHISNTPKQIQLFRALGKEPPLYGHISMILGPDRSKLSKRHGAKSITEFMKEGYLASAIVNFLAMLGWSHPEGKEILSIEELFQVYDIERVSKSNSIFNLEKLDWMNGQYIRALSPSELFELARPFIGENIVAVFSYEEWMKILDVVKDKLVFLTDVTPQIQVFLKEKIDYEPGRLDGQAVNILKQFSEMPLDHSFEVEALTALADEFISSHGLKKALFFHPLRYAITGETKGSALFAVLNILGREKVCQRIANCVRFYEPSSTGE